QLTFFEPGFNRLPRDDRNAGAGAHLLSPTGNTWNSDTNQHLVVAQDEASGGSNPFLSGVPPSLDASSPIIIDTAFRLRLPSAAYIPDEHRIAVSLRSRRSLPPEIALYTNAGALTDRLNLAAI